MVMTSGFHPEDGSSTLPCPTMPGLLNGRASGLHPGYGGSIPSLGTLFIYEGIVLMC